MLSLLLLPNEKVLIKTRPPSRHTGVSVLIADLAKINGDADFHTFSGITVAKLWLL